MLERPLFLPHKILQGVDVNTQEEREEGCEKSHLRDRQSSVASSDVYIHSDNVLFGLHALNTQIHMPSARAYSCRLVFPSTSFNRMYRVRGSGLETTKDSMHQCSLVLVPNPPFAFLVTPAFLSPPLFPLISLFLFPNFPSPPPALLLLSYRRHRRPDVWFWAQMA